MATKQLRARLDDHLTYDRFLSAHERASKSKGLRNDVLRFNLNMTSNLFRIMNVVGSGRYQPSEYWQF